MDVDGSTVRNTQQQRFKAGQRDWLVECFDGLTAEFNPIVPSEWAQEKRYLPASVTSMPGYYSFDYTPYIREILDCLAVESPVRELAFMKGAQLGATAGVLENAIGYYIEHVKHAPMMLVTADQDLAQLRMESYVTPMLQHSGLTELITSSDWGNRRKTGKTDKKIEWVGGGFLIPFGAQNANKLRSTSVRVLLGDEIDGWPNVVGKDGDPVSLTKARTQAFETTRKVVWASTPLILGESKIEKLFARGDQRRYFVKCLRCDHEQVLRWERVDSETGGVTGVVWELDEDGRLVPDSVRYLCEACAHPHQEADKQALFAGGSWRPTAVAATADVRSYHLSALYSPDGMMSWAECVQLWLEAWDVERNKPKDIERLQVFYNTVLGEPFELRGDRVRFEQVSPHRRHAYRMGEVPNTYAEEHAGGQILLLTAAADVHADNLKAAVWGWCRDRRVFLIDYRTLEGDTDALDNPNTWGELREIFESKAYKDARGWSYRPRLSLVDSGYRTDHVYQFCSRYSGGVFPVKGQSQSSRSVRVPEHHEFETPHGLKAFGVTVDLYKDRWSAALRREWSGQGLQPGGHFNAPRDATDAQLKELTAEVKRAKYDARTKKIIGFEWHRKGGAANELWDLLVYGNAALDLIAYSYCREHLELDHVDWRAFWDYCERGGPGGAPAFFTK